VPESVPANPALNSSSLRCRLQVPAVERSRPVRLHSVCMRAGKDPVLRARICAKVPPAPQRFRKARIQRYGFALRFCFAFANVLKRDRARDTDFKLLEIDVLPLQRQQFSYPQSGHHVYKHSGMRRLFEAEK